MKIVNLVVLIFTVWVGGNGCGFLNDAKMSEGYMSNVAVSLWPDEPAVALVSWPILLPIHAGGLAVCATLDQTVRTFKSTVPASVETKNYFLTSLPDDNVILHRTLILPKFVATPLIWVGSYFARWFVPIPEDEFVFDELEE